RWRGRCGSGAPPACGRWCRGCCRGSWPFLRVAGEGSTLPPPGAARTATDGTPGIGQRNAAAGGTAGCCPGYRWRNARGRPWLTPGRCFSTGPDGTRCRSIDPIDSTGFRLPCLACMMPDARAATTPRLTIAALLCLCLAACGGDDVGEHGAAPAQVV